MSTSYDEVVYVACPERATHPDNLAALATLHGLSPAPPPRCRVLEIGCATGGNLLGLGEAYPGSSFLGVDPSPRQVGLGREAAASLGLSNLRLEAVTADALPADAGPFDYVLCHGVYSWVPQTAREGILAACRRLLAPHGVAYVSYNVKPGFLLRQAVREMLLYHTSGLSDPAQKAAQARALMHLLAGGRPDERAWARALNDEAVWFAEGADSYILHEYLEEDNEAFFLRDFVQDAGRHGLRYLCEAASHTCLDALPPAVRAAFGGVDDPIEAEQYIDFYKGRQFRRTLLVRAETASERPSAAALGGLLVSAACRAEAHPDAPGVVGYRNDNGDGLETADPGYKAILGELIARRPAAVPWADLCAAVAARLGGRDPAPEAMRLVLANLVTLHCSPPRFTLTPGPRPCASRVARWQARQGGPVTDLLGRRADLGPFALALLPLLDGTRDRGALAEEMARRIDPACGAEAERRAAAALGPALEGIARSALLTA